MKITYKREMKHNYMIIEPVAKSEDSYETRMMASNHIDGLLKFHIKQVDGGESYYYEITSKQPLARLLEHTALGSEQLSRFIVRISSTLDRMEAYLLEEDHILLDPEHVYMDPETYLVSLCLLPGYKGNFPCDLSKLLQYLLGKIDHQDKECVVMAYGLYQESLKENYGMDDLLLILGKSRTDGPHKMEEWDGEEEAAGRETCEETCSGFLCDIDQVERREALVSREEGIGKRWGKTEPGSQVVTGIFLFLAAVAGSLAMVWLFLGWKGVKDYWYVLAAADGIMAVVLLLRPGKERETLPEHADRSVKVNDIYLRGGKRSDLGKEGRRAEGKKPEKFFSQKNAAEWQMIFEEEEEEAPVREGQRKEVCQTVLLAGEEPDLNKRYLHSLDASVEDIVISYVPFLIGKQEGLVDYVLNHNTISRIHARIDKIGEGYQITDLNSTNGVTVGERVLDANETAPLHPGDKVLFANIGFIFT